MSEEFIRRDLREILGDDIIISKKRAKKQDQNKQIFITALETLSGLLGRSTLVEQSFGISLEQYDNTFLLVINGLLKLHFDEPQLELINWWLFEKFLPTGDVQILNDTETGDEIPSETAEDIWNLISKIKKLER